MSTFDDPLLPLLPLVLVAAGLLPLVMGELVGKVFSTLVVATGWLAGAGLIAMELMLALTYGGWDKVAEGGWRGATLLSGGPIALSAEPMSLLLVAAVHLGAGALLLGSGRAWGGGQRRENTPTTAAQLGGALLAVALVETEALAATFADALGLCALAAATGAMLLLTSRGTLDGLTGAGRLFIVHRLGDIGLLLAAALLLAGFGSLTPEVLLPGILDTPPHGRGTGALTGYPSTWVYTGAAAGLLVGIGTRTCLFPFLGLMKHTHQAPAVILGVSHGVAFAGSGVILALKVAPLFPLAPLLAHGGAALAMLSALALVASALSTDDGVLSAVRLVYALSAATVAIVLVGDLATGVLGALVLLLAVPVVLLPLGTCVEAMQGLVELSKMGGLSRALRKSDAVLSVATVALVGTPGFVGFFFFERAIFGALLSRRADLTTALLLTLFVFLFSLALWRIVHLAFSGDAPRAPAPAVLVEASWRRIVLPTAVALVLASSGALVLLPDVLVARWVDQYFVPYDVFMWPSTLAMGATFHHVAGHEPFPLTEHTRWIVMAAVGLASVGGYVLSTLLFRNGGRASLRAHLSAPLVQRLARWLDEGLSVQSLTDKVIAVPLSQAGRVTNDFLLPFFVDGPLSRLPGLSAGLAQVVLRVVHAGDVQRALAFLVLALGVAFAWWSRTP